MGMSEYETFCLSKSRHTIYLQGQSTPASGGYYVVQGSMSIMAIPTN
jgi:hypothetical protein